MSDDTTKTQQPAMGQPREPAPEVSIGRSRGLVAELGMQDPVLSEEADTGLTSEIAEGEARITRANPPEASEQQEEDHQDGEAQGDQEAGEQAEPLPAFDAEKAEVVEAYRSAFVTETGTLNMEALSKEWDTNSAGDMAKGTLNEDTYKFLQSLGIDKETVKRFEAGRVAEVQVAKQALFTRAGGEDKYAAAIAWAKAGGYTPEARKAFNAVLDKGGQDLDDAVDLLMSRYSKANPAARRAAPNRTAANAGNPPSRQPGSGAKPYESHDEYSKDLRAAQHAGDNKALEEVRARFRASAKMPWRTGR